MATRSRKAQNTAPEAEAQTAPAVAPCAEQNNNKEGARPPAPRHYRCIAACYHGRRLWQVGEETVTTDEMPHHFVEVKGQEGDTA